MTQHRYEIAGVLDLDDDYSRGEPVYVYSEDDAIATAKRLVEEGTATHKLVAVYRTPSALDRAFDVRMVEVVEGNTVVGPWLANEAKDHE